MLEGVTSGSPWSNKTNKEKVSGAAKKVVQYINMKEGGHYMYGMGFMFCQVLLTYHKPHIHIDFIFSPSYFNYIIFQIFWAGSTRFNRNFLYLVQQSST